ncbi:TRAP transporter small permease [Amorphus sp. 3PC139-8]|uniref:TRAP transporter small permease n=1 Tax=Amorphus sp. 3PC139-8 TaxID=2735676 RepID=UPI00345D093D
MSETRDAGADGSGRPPGWSRAVEWVFSAAAALLLFLMMTITFLDVLGRYFFNHPLGFAFEVTQLTMAGLVFTALPSVTLRGQHVTAGLFENAFSGRLKHARDLIVALIVAVGCGFLAWRLSMLAERFMMWGDETSVLKFPIGLVAWLGVGCLVAGALAALVLAAQALTAGGARR